MNIERKTLSFELKEVTAEGIVRGYAAAIGNVDDGGDKILPGAFDRSLARSKGIMPIYWGHSWDRIPLGYGTEATADEKYLHVGGELTMNIQAVKDAYESLAHAKKVGFSMGISIGYRVPKNGFEMQENIRLLKEVDVFEWSITPFPMNLRARVTSVKGIDLDTLTERDFEELLRDVGFASREAKTIISRGFRSLLDERKRDAAHSVELPPQLDELRQRVQFERSLAELRNLIRR